MATRKKSQTVLNVFDSWGTFVDFADKSPLTHFSRFTSEYDITFTGSNNMDQAMNLARNGWNDGTVQAIDFSSPIIDQISSQLARDEYNFDTTGLCFDVARVLENEPECWMRHDVVNVDSPGKVIKLVVAQGCPGYVSKEQIIARGATIGALVLLLERAGIRAQIDVTYFASVGSSYKSSDKSHSHTVITVKQPSQDLDLARLMFAIGHPSMLRRLLFSAVGASFTDQNIGSYDCPEQFRGDVYVSRMAEINWENRTDATNWVIAQLQAQGIQLTATV